MSASLASFTTAEDLELFMKSRRFHTMPKYRIGLKKALNGNLTVPDCDIVN